MLGAFSLKSSSRESSPESDRVSPSPAVAQPGTLTALDLLQILESKSHYSTGPQEFKDAKWIQGLEGLDYKQTKVLQSEISDRLSDLTLEGSPRVSIYKEAYKLVHDRFNILQEQKDREWLASLDSEERKELAIHVEERRKQKEAEESGYTWV
jgi:hypothetical protein